MFLFFKLRAHITFGVWGASKIGGILKYDVLIGGVLGPILYRPNFPEDGHLGNSWSGSITTPSSAQQSKFPLLFLRTCLFAEDLIDFSTAGVLCFVHLRGDVPLRHILRDIDMKPEFPRADTCSFLSFCVLYHSLLRAPSKYPLWWGGKRNQNTPIMTQKCPSNGGTRRGWRHKIGPNTNAHFSTQISTPALFKSCQF